MFALGLFAAALVVLIAVFATRKPKALKRPDLAEREEAVLDFENDRRAVLRRAQSIRPRQPTRTGTVYVPPSEPTTSQPPDDDMANVIRLVSLADATPPEPSVHHSAPVHHAAPEPCAPSHDTSSYHSPSVDSHCHSSSSDFGGGFDGGGHGGHH